jgi:hypothetical protein
LHVTSTKGTAVAIQKIPEAIEISVTFEVDVCVRIIVMDGYGGTDSMWHPQSEEEYQHLNLQCERSKHSQFLCLTIHRMLIGTTGILGANLHS